MFHLCIFPNEKHLSAFFKKSSIKYLWDWIYRSEGRPAILIVDSAVDGDGIMEDEIEEICFQAATEGGEHYPISDCGELIKEKWLTLNRRQLILQAKAKENSDFDLQIEDNHN